MARGIQRQCGRPLTLTLSPEYGGEGKTLIRPTTINSFVPSDRPRKTQNPARQFPWQSDIPHAHARDGGVAKARAAVWTKNHAPNRSNTSAGATALMPLLARAAVAASASANLKTSAALAPRAVPAKAYIYSMP
jgi:hypothetical protein